MKVKTTPVLLLYTVLFICLLNGVHAQLPLKDFYFRHLKTDQGLTNGMTQFLLRDHEGFLWISTYNGLNCYDGSHFKTWKADLSQNNRLPCPVVEGLCEDQKGFLWCATNVGVSRFDKKTNSFENYKLVRPQTGYEEYGTMLSIVCCRNGMIVTHGGSGIFIFNPEKNKFEYYAEDNKTGSSEFESINVNSIVEDPFEEGLWICSNMGIRYFDLEKKIFYSHLKNPKHLPLFNNHKCYPLTIDHQNRLYFFDAIDQQFVIYDIKQQTLKTITAKGWQTDDLYVSSILVDKSNNIWISALSRHIFFIDGKTEKVYEIKNDAGNNYSIAANFFRDSWQDEDGTVYLATSNGVSFTNPGRNFFSIHRFPDDVSHVKQYALSMLLNTDNQDNIWCTPSNQFLLKFDTKNEKYTKYDIIPQTSKNIESYIKIATMEPAGDKLYFGTIDGIYVYDMKRDAFELLKDIPDSEGLSGKYILQMLMTREHELWFTSHHNGLFRYNTVTHQYRHYTFNEKDSNSFTKNYIFDLLQDGEGNVWISSEFEGLLKYNPAKDNFSYLFKNFSTDPTKLSFTEVTNDAENNLWLLNYVTGVMRYNQQTGEVKVMGSENKLSDFAYHSPIVDQDKNLWLACFDEYSIMNMKTMEADNFVIDYSRNNTEYMNHFVLLSGNRIAAETRNGIFIFNIKNRIPDISMEPINVSNFNAGSLNIPFLAGQQDIRLKYSQNFFSFDFSTLSFLKNPNIKFAYQLEGVDDGWINCESRQTVYYTNVGGGDYTFRVKALDGKGVWHENTKPVHINVASIFYATVWFKFILLAVLAICIYWYYRLWKKKELKEKSEEAISYFANSVSGKNKVEEILWDITHNVIARSDFVDCVVYLLDENRNVLVQKAAYGNKNPEANKIVNPIEIPLGKGIVGTVAKTGKAEIVNDTSIDERYIADDEARLSELSVPIKYEERVIGVIDSEHPKRNFFTHEHLELMMTIASITGTKIVNAQKEIEITEKERRLEDLKIQMAYARQQALRSQMNPHFIFNCLNSINGFILQNDAITASTFLIRFSKLIRLILEHSNEKLISLQSELDALKLYIEMEKLRFEKKFSYEIKVDDDIEQENVMVPPLIFQPFIENSIWHGLLHKEDAGTLSVNISQVGNMLECMIEDDGIGREASREFKSKSTTKKKSLGMQLTKERLSIMYEQENRQSSVEVVDLVNEFGEGAGTRVIIRIEYNPDL